MTRYFMRDTPLYQMEQMMMTPPHFKPRGHGQRRSGFQYQAKDVKCEYCMNYSRKNLCPLDQCICLEERIEAGTLSLEELLRDCLNSKLKMSLWGRLAQMLYQHPLQFFRKSEPSDWAIRMCQAIVAHSMGFTDRNQWTDQLKKQSETLFSFQWTAGSVSDHVIRWCKETGHDWQYSHLGELQVSSGGEWRRIDYECDSNSQTRVFLTPKPLPENELKALAEEPAIRLRDLVDLGLPDHDVYLVHSSADVGWVPAADLSQLSDRGKAQFAEVLDAKVAAVRPGPYGTELVLDGVDPQLLTQYDEAIADCARAESAMKFFM